MPEWLKGHAWKACVLLPGYRGFESHPLRTERAGSSNGSGSTIYVDRTIAFGRQSTSRTMISSMTGFGRGQAEDSRVTVVVELKSVNSRFCEISVRGPRALAERETDVQNRIKQSVARGRVTAHVNVEPTAGADPAITVNQTAALAYRDQIEELSRALGLSDPIRLDHIVRFADVFEKSDSADVDPDTLWQVTGKALEQAVDHLCRMRETEGQALRKDLVGRLDALERDLDTVNERAPGRIATARTRLQERIAELIDDDRIDPDRLEFEIALLADKLDVNEEAVRLASHIKLFRDALDSSEPIGRKLNFIAQEINREINTIGSKANDSELAHVVVRMKEELERIREQVENVQ